MAFDALVANAGRLQILTALAVQERQEFVHLRDTTQLTDGNLAAHAKRLKSGGLIEIDKQFRAGKPVTSFHLTPAGRTALESHARRLLAALSQRRLAPATTTGEAPGAEAEVAPVRSADDAAPASDRAPIRAKRATREVAISVEYAAEEDWVD